MPQNRLTAYFHHGLGLELTLFRNTGSESTRKYQYFHINFLNTAHNALRRGANILFFGIFTDNIRVNLRYALVHIEPGARTGEVKAVVYVD